MGKMKRKKPEVQKKPDREKTSRPKKRKNKLNLVFDDTKRREFLGGFQKRNIEKKKKAAQEWEEKLKEEKKRIKQESKEEYKKLVVSRRPIPELEQLLSNEYENDDVTVKVVELSTTDIAEKTNWIGQNKPKEEESSEEEEEESSEDEIPGMGLKERRVKEVPVSEGEGEEGEEGEGDDKEDGGEKVFTSKKDINKFVKHEALKKIQNSKAFQAKNKMEKIKNKKKSSRLKHQNKKVKSKKTKTKQRGKGK